LQNLPARAAHLQGKRAAWAGFINERHKHSSERNGLVHAAWRPVAIALTSIALKHQVILIPVTLHMQDSQHATDVASFMLYLAIAAT